MSNSNRRRRRPRPEGAPEPGDYQAPKSAAQAEAEGVETVTVTWHGVELEVPRDPQEWDAYTVMMPLSGTPPNILGALSGLLGPIQIARMQRGYPDAKMPQFFELWNQICKATGFGKAGNS